jgi:2-amino-4-hydroxy-6-hydroxymethyldihydropteridine diphosphokinase
VCDVPGLILPRPDLLRRAFMLKPLADLAPELMHPTQHRTIGELWTQFPATAQAFVAVTIPRSGRHRPPGSAR